MSRLTINISELINASEIVRMETHASKALIIFGMKNLAVWESRVFEFTVLRTCKKKPRASD